MTFLQALKPMKLSRQKMLSATSRKGSLGIQDEADDCLKRLGVALELTGTLF